MSQQYTAKHQPSGTPRASVMETHAPVQLCRGDAEADVGAVRRSADAASAIASEYLSRTVSDAEILDHVEHCTHLLELAYGRYIATKNPADRAEAFELMRQRDEALKALSPAAKAAREAAIQRAIDEGVDYFQSAHALELGRARA